MDCLRFPFVSQLLLVVFVPIILVLTIKRECTFLSSSRPTLRTFNLLALTFTMLHVASLIYILYLHRDLNIYMLLEGVWWDRAMPCYSWSSPPTISRFMYDFL